MKKKAAVPFILGIALILCSLCFVVISQIQARANLQQNQQAVSALLDLLPDRTPGVPETYPVSGMPVLAFDGTDYVAIVDIPAFGVTLPVVDQWNSRKLARSPARFSGSAYDHSLVIGGADSAGQFGFCGEIGHEAYVRVTDMTGAQFSYQVSRIDRAKHADPQWLMREEYDLTLFCRDAYSLEYIAVRCQFAGGA